MKVDSTDIPNHGLEVDTRLEVSKARQAFEASHRTQIDWDNVLEQLEILKEQMELLKAQLEAMTRELL